MFITFQFGILGKNYKFVFFVLSCFLPIKQLEYIVMCKWRFKKIALLYLCI